MSSNQTGIRINKSKVVHIYWVATDRTDCGAGGMGEISLNGGVATEDAITCKRCLKALAAMMEQARDEAVAMDERRTIARAYLSTPSGVVLSDAEIEQALADRDAENEAFFDALAVRYAQEDAATSPAALSRRQRKAARRAGRAKLRRTAPQMRAAGRARRAQRGTARATAKTLLVAVGVPEDVADSYTSAFSRGAQVPTAPKRIRLGEHSSKRVEVKRYTWSQFAARLEAYAPVSLEAQLHFDRVRDLVLA